MSGTESGGTVDPWREAMEEPCTCYGAAAYMRCPRDHECAEAMYRWRLTEMGRADD